MKKETRRRKGCGEIARCRARQARRKGMNPFLVALVFVTAILSVPLLASLPAVSRRPCSTPEEDWPVTDYERGYSGPHGGRTGRRQDRYGVRPAMRRLMRDLRRPAARADAGRILLTRVADVDLREWVAERIRKDQINRLSIFVRPGIADEAIVAAWRAELDAEIAEKEAAADEAHVQARVIRTLTGLTSGKIKTEA